MDNNDFVLRRKQLVQYLIDTEAIKTKPVEKAFAAVRRELFMPSDLRQYAYDDSAFPIGSGQTISQPTTIAIMLELLQVAEGQNVLEVGSGCGYVLALLSEIASKKGKAYGIEIVGELVEQSRKNLEAQGYENVEVLQGDGTLGLPEKMPFDRILVSAACPFLPKPLFDQLAEKGRAVAPVGDSWSQQLQVIKKFKSKPLKEDFFGDYFVFVPLRGKYGIKSGANSDIKGLT